MIRTCRLFLPVRKNYNVSILNQRTCQAKQSSMEFSFYSEQWKENYFPRKLFDSVRSEFSTFKQNEKINPDNSQQKKSRSEIPSDHLSFKESKQAEKRHDFSSDSSEQMTVDFPTFQENILSKPLINNSDVKPIKAEEAETRDSVGLSLVTFNRGNHTLKETENSYITQVGSPRGIIKKLKLLAKSGKRETPFLNPLIESMRCNNKSYTLTECSDLLFSFAKLSVADLPLLNKLSEQILQKLSVEGDRNPKELVSLLHSVCKLRYRNCELIEALCKHISELDTELNPEQVTRCLFGLSNVNVQSPYSEHFINVLANLKVTDFQKTKNFLNYVWASVILNKQNFLPVEHLEIVLSKSFYDQLTISGENNLLTKIKLSNISGVASSLKDYKGPVMDKVVFSPVISKSKHFFLATVRDSLSYIFPKTGFIQTLSYIGSGVFLDIECCLDSSMAPVRLKNAENQKKIGLVLMDHNDYCLDKIALTGVNAFKMEQIKRQGYITLIISYSQFPFKNPLSSKIAYLRTKFEEVLA